MSGRTTPPQPGTADTPSAEFLALRARYRLTLLLAEATRVRMRELEVHAELAQLVRAPEIAAAASDLARVVEQLARGER